MPLAPNPAQADVSVAGTPATTTVLQLTGHNVSSPANYTKANFPANFTGTSNNNGTNFAVDPTQMDDSQNPSAPVNISKLPVKSLMPGGWSGKAAIWTEFYAGLSSHPTVPGNEYTNAAATLADIHSRGYDVVIQNYYGINFSGQPGDAAMDAIAAHLAPGMTFAAGVDQ